VAIHYPVKDGSISTEAIKGKVKLICIHPIKQLCCTVQTVEDVVQ
jgi:hypothetical protein